MNGVPPPALPIAWSPHAARIMLREIGGIRQDSDRGHRRWFQDDYFDLYLWQDKHGSPIAFHLCYARNAAEGAITWRAGEGYTHASVDAGEHAAFVSMSPVLRPASAPPYFRIYRRLLDATAGWDPVLRGFMLQRLREYRKVLFGTHRRPRRRRARSR